MSDAHVISIISQRTRRDTDDDMKLVADWIVGRCTEIVRERVGALAVGERLRIQFWVEESGDSSSHPRPAPAAQIPAPDGAIQRVQDASQSRHGEPQEAGEHG